MSNQKNQHSNNQDIYDDCKYYFNKIGQDTAAVNDDYNFSAGDYSEDIDTDLETPTSIISSKAIEPNQYIKIHQNLTPIEPLEITAQNPSRKIIQGINSQRHYLPYHTTIVTPSQCHHPSPTPADVTEIYRRHCKKNKVTASIIPQQQTQRSQPILMLSGTPTTLDQKLQPQYCQQQQPQLVLRCVPPTRAENEQPIYVTNSNSRNYSCRYCATELMSPIQTQQQPATKRYIQHCVTVDPSEPLIEYYADDLIDEYNDGIEYDDTPCDLIPTYNEQHQPQNQRCSSSRCHKYAHSSQAQLQEMRDIQRSVTTVTNGVNNANMNRTRNVVLQVPPPSLSSNTVAAGGTVKSTIRGSASPINDSSTNNGIYNSNDGVDSYIPTRLQNNVGNNIRHRVKMSREYASTHAPIPVSGNGNNSDHIPQSLMRPPHQGDVIQTSQVHYHMTTPIAASHRQHPQRHHRTTVLAPRYYKRTSNGGTALYKPPSKLCLPVFSQPEYPSSFPTIHKKHRMHHATNSRNRILQQQHCGGETMDDKNIHVDRIKYESAPGFYSSPDGNYNVIQQEQYPPHPKRKLKNKLLTLINPKRNTNNIGSCDMEGLLAHFETLFDIKEKEYIDEHASSKENVKGTTDKTLSSNEKSVKYIPSQTTLKKSRLSSLLLKSKQEQLKNLTKLKKCESTISQQTCTSKTRLKRKHSDKVTTSKLNNSINDNKNNENTNKNMTDDIILNNKNTSTSKDDVLSSSIVNDTQQYEHVDEKRPFINNAINSDSLENLLADLMASGYIDQEQHDKSKSINQKMREDAQQMLNIQQTTSKEHLIDSHEDGDNQSITNSCVGTTDSDGGEIIVSNNKKINNTVVSRSSHDIHDSNNNTSATNNDEHGVCKTTGATTSMPMLSSSNNDNNHNINYNNATSSPSGDDITNMVPINNNSIPIPEKIQSQNLILSETDKTKSYSHISSQTINIETMDSNEFSTKSTTNNLTCVTGNSNIKNVLQMNVPLKSTTSVKQIITHPDEDHTVALELHRSKSYIIKLIDRALSKELGTPPEPRLSVESPSATNRQRIQLNPNNFNTREKTENSAHIVTNTEICSTIKDANVEISKESKPCTSSFKIHPEEASCLKQLKQLRWNHLKHIQEEVQRLQDLERFLDSCNASNSK